MENIKNIFSSKLLFQQAKAFRRKTLEANISNCCLLGHGAVTLCHARLLIPGIFLGKGKNKDFSRKYFILKFLQKTGYVYLFKAFS